jgi:hypothetical protein
MSRDAMATRLPIQTLHQADVMVGINREWLRLILPRTRKPRGTALRRLEPKRLVRYFLGVAVVSGSALQLTYAR